jgi:hypothetical protein
VTYGFQIISTRLLNTFVSSDGGISGCSCQVLSIFVRDVLALTVFVALRQTEVNDVHIVACALCASDQKVVRLDVTMDNSFLVHLFEASDHLLGNEEHSFEVKLALARLEQVFERRPQQVHHHHVEVLVRNRTICADVVKPRDACCKENVRIRQMHF